MGNLVGRVIAPLFLTGVVSLCSLLLGCNHPPETEVKRQFGTGGTVTYNLSGTDIDPGDFVTHILVRINNSEANTFPNESSQAVPILEGDNSIEATAYDTRGEPDETPATDSFTSPSKEEGRNIIDNILAGRSDTYESLERDALISIGESDSFHVDYLVRRLDGSDAMISYNPAGNPELQIQELLDAYGIPNLHLVGVPESEIQARLEEFIAGGYN